MEDEKKLVFKKDRARNVMREKNIKNKDIAEAIGITQKHVSNVLNGKAGVSYGTAKQVEELLGVPLDFLTGETDDPSPPGAREAMHPYETRGQNPPPLPGNFVEIPLLDMPTTGTPGALQRMANNADDSMEKTIVSRDTLRIDNMKKPFGIRVSGNSMERAGISAGVIAIVNPAEEFKNGSAYLLYYNGEWFIRWVFVHPDGRVELHAASDKPTISVDAETANDKTLFSIAGKIVEVLRSNKPADMF